MFRHDDRPSEKKVRWADVGANENDQTGNDGFVARVVQSRRARERTLRSLLPRTEGGREINPITRALLKFNHVAKTSHVVNTKRDLKIRRDLNSPPASALVKITTNEQHKLAKV